MLYRAPIWCNTFKKHINALQIIQNKIARISTGADFRIRIKFLHTIFETPYNEEVIVYLSQNRLNIIRHNTNSLIKNIV